MPVLIGGDLNTGNNLPPDFDWRDGTIFTLVKERGYSWGFTVAGNTTRPSFITPHPDRVMKLDWLAGRRLHTEESGALVSIMADEKPLSDHDCFVKNKFFKSGC